MDKDDVQRRVREEEDYVRCPKLNNSLERFLSKSPDGVENNVIARLLAMSEQEVQELYEEAVEMLRDQMEE